MTLSEAREVLRLGTPEQLGELVEYIVNYGLAAAGAPDATEWAVLEDRARYKLYPAKEDT